MIVGRLALVDLSTLYAKWEDDEDEDRERKFEKKGTDIMLL